MTRMFHLIAVAGLVLVASGCVSQEKYNALKLDRDALSEQLGQAQKDAATARAESELAKANLAALTANGNNYTALVTNLTSQNANLQAALDELNRKYADAIARGGISGPLPQQLNDALQSFANANPDLVDFDSAKGIVKFRSDVTFTSGDASIQPKAREVIKTFASILNSPAASGYELLVAGHTDNTRVVNRATIDKGHKDNWYLSAHRAITVAEELMGQGTNSQRIGVIGYADQRPAASNASESGKASNRRVEVLILPTTVKSTGNMAARPGTARPAQTGNKDAGSSVQTPTGPALNK